MPIISQSETKNPRINQLSARWQQVWLLALERQRKLNDALDRLEEVTAPGCSGMGKGAVLWVAEKHFTLVLPLELPTLAGSFCCLADDIPMMLRLKTTFCNELPINELLRGPAVGICNDSQACTPSA